MDIPAFKSHIHAAVLPGEGVLLLSENGSRALHGRAYELVAPLVDGRRSADEIVDILAGQVDAATVYYVLNLLESKGCLTEAAPEIPADTAAFWHGMGLDPRTALAALQNRKVAIFATGGFDPSELYSALERAGVQTGPQESAHLWLVLTDDYQRDELAAINEDALQGGHPWLLARVTGPQLWLGPLFIPGETGCWQCLCSRLKRNRAAHSFVSAKKGLSTPPLTALGSLPSTRATVYQMAATAAAQFLAGVSGTLAGKVLSLDWASWTPQTHQLLRHPHCPSCGTAGVPEAKPVVLQPGRAAFTWDCGHRQVAPEQTLKKYEHLISPITGVVTLLEPVLRDEEVAHVFMAGHNSALKMERLDFLKRSLRSSSAGKGVSEIQARTSALCEAIERYSGELAGGEVRVTCALRDWPPGQAYHPNEIMLYSSKQYKEREVWNKRGSRFNRVPEPFGPDLMVDWTPLWSLTQERHKYVPTQLVYYGAPAREGENTFYAIGCSNGNASGNTLAEAVLQGFFELVERDAVALWWYNRLPRPGVDLATFGEPYLLELAEHYRTRYRRETWALDITSDLGIPAFVAVSRRLEKPQERILFGLGCHLDARIALQRAFAEMNQMLGIADYAGQDGEQPLEDHETLTWLREATLANQPYMAPDPAQPLRRFTDHPKQHSGDFLQDIASCRQIIEARGMELLVLDQTRADVGMTVVKVVVPGLRHFWARFAPGRLYDVPVRMGWLKEPLQEEDLNPIPMFF